jgi:hypothetical protein
MTEETELRKGEEEEREERVRDREGGSTKRTEEARKRAIKQHPSPLLFTYFSFSMDHITTWGTVHVEVLLLTNNSDDYFYFILLHIVYK